MTDVSTRPLAGDSVICPNDGEYKVSIHAFDNVDAFGYAYNEIGEDDDNRWHVQGHFDPYPDHQNSFAFDRAWVEFRVEYNGGDYYVNFDNSEPTESQMSSGGDQEYPNIVGDVFNVASGYYPYLSAGEALISLAFSGGSGSLTVDPYNYVDWHIPLQSAGLPNSQDNAVGARFDVENQASPSDANHLSLPYKSELGYYRYGGHGTSDFFTTGVASDQGAFTPVD